MSMNSRDQFQFTVAIGAGGYVDCLTCNERHWHIGGSGHELQMWADRHDCPGGAA